MTKSANQHSRQNQQDQDILEWKKGITVKNYGTFGLKFALVHDPWDLQDDLSSFMLDTDSIVTSVAPFKQTKYMCQQQNYSVLKLVPVGVNFPSWKKLSKFLQLNKQGLISRSQKQKNEMILITNQFNLKNWIPETDGPLCALYIKDAVPEWVARNKYGLGVKVPGCHLNYSWELISTLLMFPKELNDLIKQTDTMFEVVGTSGLADMLRDTIRSTRNTVASTFGTTAAVSSSSTSTTKKVLFVDRLDGLLYRTSLQNELHSSTTQIFAFGSSTVIEQIAPTTEAYPKNTGGYITTDARNIMRNTSILDRMTETARKNNVIHPGAWRVILHDKTISQIMRSGTGDNAQNAIFKILTCLTNNDFGILENWGEISNEQEWTTATLDWFDTIVRAHLHTYQSFYFVDDSSSTAYQEHYPLIQFVKSSSL